VSGLNAAQRAVLERLIVRARSVLEQDLEAQAEGRYGINRDGTIEDEAALHLDPSALADRREIVAIVEHLRIEGETAAGAVARLIREAAFTHLNRLVAIRVAEAMALVPPSLAEGRASRGFREVLETAPLVASDETGGYWTYLRLCGDEMAGDAPVLFDPRNPLLTLSPGVGALDDLVTLFSDSAAREIWTASDTFGWAYQFFNTGDERRQMREESSAPRNSRELAVRNQFFTPRYVVDFLVQNTLGRRLLEAQLDSPLLDALPLLVDPPTEQGEPLSLDEVRVLDPACGSGHFLLGCYDLLERAWQLQGVQPADAAPLIVPSLWGIDIDPRCAQVASAAIVFRARRHCRDLPLPRPNVITARALPDGSESWEHLLASLPADRRGLVQRMREALARAPMLGPLLKVEEQLAAEIRRHFTGSDVADGTLAEGIAPDAFGEVESEVLDVLQRAADAASSTVAERLLAAEAGDAIRFVDAMRQRYDAVLMNPPFGAPVPDTKVYLQAAYPWISTRTHDLFCTFVGRGIELCRSGGYVGALTTRAGLFLSSYERWRREVFLANRPVALADLGHGVMEQALVEAAAYAMRSESKPNESPGTFIRLLRESDRGIALHDAITSTRSGSDDPRVFRVSPSAFEDVPGARIAYWAGASLLRLFADLPALEGNGRLVRRGLQTGDDFRFLRASWEVDASRIAGTRAETEVGKRWAAISKGGEYSPFWSDLHLVADWKFDGQEVRAFSKAIVPSPQHYFRAGLTWPRRTNSGFGIRLLPAGAIFSDKGPGVIADVADLVLLLGWLSSRLVRGCIEAMVAAGEEATSGGASRSYETGLVQQVPWVGDAISDRAKDVVRQKTLEITRLRAEIDEIDETTRRFLAPRAVPSQGQTMADALMYSIGSQDQSFVRILENVLAVENEFVRALSLDDDAVQYLNEEVGTQPASYSDEHLDESEFARLYQTRIDAVIDEVVAHKGGSRAIANLTFFADRRLEVLSHTFECHPRALVHARDRLNLMPPEEPRRAADELFSYLVGVAFGRWDVRIGRDRTVAPPLPDVLDPLPVYPPGMLARADKAMIQDLPADYPLRLPPAGILLDEAGHEWDVEAAFLAAATALFVDPESVCAEILQILRARSIRDHLRRGFFKDHIARYSKSRRKAPIYWPLTVPSRNWGVWIYAPRLSREMLFAVAGEVARREALAAEAIRHLEAERDAGGSGRSAREVTEALAGEETLAEEFRTFRAEADRIAGLGWEPDLDDGIILCAAPLASLFHAWPDAGKEREQIRKGEYPWATVSRWKDAI
jgi:hypothetical protein